MGKVLVCLEMLGMLLTRVLLETGAGGVEAWTSAAVAH